MKIGVITNCFKKSHEEGILKAASLGLNGVQIYATNGEFSPELSTEKKDFYKKLLKDNGLVVSALCGDMGGHGFEIAEDNPVRIEKTKRIIDLAKEFGSNVVTTHLLGAQHRSNCEYVRRPYRSSRRLSAKISLTVYSFSGVR